MFQKERERKHKRENKNAAKDFSDKYDLALFKYPIKFGKFLIISLKILNKFLILFACKKNWLYV